MSFLGRLFGKSRNNRHQNMAGLAEHMEYLNSLTKPAVRLIRTEEAQFNKIGGIPHMPDDLAWPEWNGKPLAFLCQIDLSNLPPECCLEESPHSGCLYFFYDQEQGTWGFDPKDRGSWRVLHTPQEAKNCMARKPPEQLAKDGIYSEEFVMLSVIRSYPDWQDGRVAALNLAEGPFEEYDSLCTSAFEGQPAHHLFGYPSPIQGNDMDLECQLVSAGVYCGTPSGYKDPRARDLSLGRTDWTLLLQLDTDDGAGMMWGDAGMLYFWIRKDDLRAQHFDDCWMVLQCG